MVVLIGDQRPFLVALFSPAVEELERWAKANKIEFTDHEELTSHAETQQLFADIVERQNAVLARFEQIKQFRILAEPLTVEGGHLTPTLKVKRRVVEEQFAHLVKEMYS